jgi:CelD/BcsL family acetyltransferase involved in cellulose biosynthesis
MAGDGRPRWDLYDDCLHVAQRSWQGRSTTGNTLCHKDVGEFFRNTHALAAKHGMLDMHLMFLGDRPIAFTYNYHCQGCVLGARTGYDPDFSNTGLGKVLLTHTFRTSFERGDHTFDRGPDYLAAKRPWLTRIVHSYRYTHYPLAAPRTQLLRMKHWLAPNGIERGLC